MEITEAMIRQNFSQHDFKLGQQYQRAYRVQEMKVTQSGANTAVECSVRGSRFYHVHITLQPDGIRVLCSCPRFADAGKCKHIVAALLEYRNKATALEPDASDNTAKAVLEAYLSIASGPEELSKVPLQLVPALSFSERPLGVQALFCPYPELTLKVGGARMYVVKNISSLLRSWEEGKAVCYGKQLTLDPALNRFDEYSAQLIDLLKSQYDEFNRVGLEDDPYGNSWLQYAQRRSAASVVLEGKAFDAFFAISQGQTVALAAGQSVVLEDGNPPVQLTVAPSGKTVSMLWALPEGALLFGSSSQLYALTDTALLRCSRDFSKKLLPLLTCDPPLMHLSKQDMPTFCSCVLPAISGYVSVQDAQGCLAHYTPDECLPCFYFDLQSDLGLVCDLLFRYGSAKVPSGTPLQQKAEIKRDALAERSAVQALSRYLEPLTNEKLFHLSDEDAIITFLSEQIDSLRGIGEVYISDRLHSRRIGSGKAAVGVSLSNGLLTLDIDTGEFPADELEALYASLLQKKKYHRLKDGRYLVLNNTPYEKIAEIAHMSQLSAKELSGGSVTVPAYRALYLNDALAQSSGLQVTRDQSYRALIRSFKNAADGDYPLSPALNGVLRPYQKTGFQWLKTLDTNGFGGILADEMGLGKTLQIIAYLSTVTRQDTGLPSLIICPASLVLNWADEFARFAPELNIAVIIGTAAERAALLAGCAAADVIVTSYDLLKRDTEQYGPLRFYCCVLDEAQNVKNQSTQASKSVKGINCAHRFVLTGTPIENRLSELWNLFDFLMPGYLFTQKRFVDKIEKPIVQSEDPAARSRLLALVQPFMLRRLKADVLRELPPKVEHLRKVILSEEERKVYLAAAAAAKKEMQAAGSGKFQIFAVLTRLRQICCDPNLCYSNFAGPASKLEACLELCAGLVENGHQILLFSQFTSMLAILAERLDALGISHFTLEGSTEKTRRAQLVKDFNAGGAAVFLISLKAGGTGLNLTAADVVIHYDPWWNMAAQNQATDRAHRFGQQAHVQVYKLIAKDTIEERILELQSKKQSLLDIVSENDDSNLLSLPKEDLLALLS